jgi:hypothetical protein
MPEANSEPNCGLGIAGCGLAEKISLLITLRLVAVTGTFLILGLSGLRIIYRVNPKNRQSAIPNP